MEYMRGSQCGGRNVGNNSRMNRGNGNTSDSRVRIPEPCRMPVADNNGCGCSQTNTTTSVQEYYARGPLGMSYIPWQKWSECELFDLDMALSHGSIFKNLVFPFERASACCRQRGGRR